MGSLNSDDQSELIIKVDSIRINRSKERDEVVIERGPEYIAAGFAGLSASVFAPLFVAGYLTWFSNDSLWQRALKSGEIGLCVFMGLFLSAFFVITCLLVTWALQSAFPRRISVGHRAVQFRNVPGFHMTVPNTDIQGVYVLTTHSNKVGWTCHVAFGISYRNRLRFLVVNWHQLCSRKKLRQSRQRFDQEEWLLDVHKPLAEMLARLMDKPVRINRNSSPFQRTPRWYWR